MQIINLLDDESIVNVKSIEIHNIIGAFLQNTLDLFANPGKYVIQS
jgi:hypothetical protein